MKNMCLNVSSSILLLMLLGLIGGSQPVRSRRILSFQKYQNKKPPDNYYYGALYNVTKDLDKTTLKVPKRNAVFNNTKIISDTKHANIQNSSDCNEHRTLLQIVIDTPSIFEVTVVSKSVTGG